MAAFVLMIGMPLFAHHGNAAYDATKTVMVQRATGIIVKPRTTAVFNQKTSQFKVG